METAMCISVTRFPLTTVRSDMVVSGSIWSNCSAKQARKLRMPQLQSHQRLSDRMLGTGQPQCSVPASEAAFHFTQLDSLLNSRTCRVSLTQHLCVQPQ